MDKYLDFTHKTLKWYSNNKRELPWRAAHCSAYSVWLSEIIMQQTRIAQGTSYFLKFIEAYPTIRHFASAKESEILKMWQGLGYYSRARNMHKTAQDIVEHRDGNFPGSYEELLKLKGVGKYTASAIASIAYGIPKAAVDGNVYRVLSRFFGISTPIDQTAGKKEFQQLSQELICKENPSDYNQAVMEFGALQCVPRNPDCGKCPLKDQCIAYAMNQVHGFPVKVKKAKQKIRYFNYFVIEQKDSIFIRKREGKDIWQKLYDFPMIESKQNLNIAAIEKELLKLHITPSDRSFISQKSSRPHILSHQKIHASFTRISILPQKEIKLTEGFPVQKSELKKYAVPKLVENYLLNESDLLHLL